MPSLSYSQINNFIDLSLRYEGRKVVQAARDRDVSRIQHHHGILSALKALGQMNENWLNCVDQSAINAFQMEQTRCFRLMRDELVAELAQRPRNAQSYEITNITIRVEAMEIDGDGQSSDGDAVDELAQMIEKLCL